MHEAVSDILVERAREADGVSRMVLVSFLAHAILVAALVVMPSSWRSSSAPPVTPMMQQGLQVNLPQSRKSTPVVAQPVYVTVPANFGRSRTVQLDKDDVRIDFLSERVRQAVLARDDKSVYIRADAAATVQDIATVMDKLKEGGVEKVGWMTKPAGQ